jgi:alkylhydroperoxidase/carboxymuconolactone decarboxylase family protein YurZ
MITLDEGSTFEMSASLNRSNRFPLDVTSTELVTVAALTALQYPKEQLQIHIESALAAGCSPQEITEVILQMALYAGLPAVRSALQAGAVVFHKAQLDKEHDNEMPSL